MSDPLTSAVVGAALPAAFSFLFQHLHRVIDRRSARSAEQQEAAQEPPVPAPACLDGDPGLTEAEPDLGRLELHAAELERLAGALSVYQRHPDRLRPDDERLLRELGLLRGLLEDVYGRHITFRGEQQPPSGAEIDQRLRAIRGRVVGAEVPGDRPLDRYVVRQEVEDTAPESEVVGIRHTGEGSARSAGEERT
ncbi:hypothetical protein [Streptomyces sp. JJ38]|uniref:hypothetical protein n=1 Tax=Streptomyces sp. JJ38 TaxID=2738128 RepID=UPI001C572F8E|nr:hypothetical protein [Streptomyces sp. JJ38]MBW1596188.1 hypothetical protein [Streptomyces sp. JJ38]